MSLQKAIEIILTRKGATETLASGPVKDMTIGRLEEILRGLDVPYQVLGFLSIEDKDIEPGKLEAYQVIKPHLDNLIDDPFFNNAAPGSIQEEGGVAGNGGDGQPV